MGLVSYPYQWQYNGVAPFDEIAAWCKANLGGYGYIKYETIWFSKSEDYFLFMLRWS